MTTGADPAAKPQTDGGLLTRLGRALLLVRLVGRYRLYRWWPGLRGRPIADLAALASDTRQALEAAGPVFVKFGQLLSTRRDLLPPALADEFALLQDRVPPFSGTLARSIVEAELGGAFEELVDFDVEPLAGASLAQVHAASLRGDDGGADAGLIEVCVKVLRPGVEANVAADIALLKDIAALADSASEDARRLRLPEVVLDYERTIGEELDLAREARNTERLRLNFADSPLLRVPRVYPRLSTGRVLTLERVRAMPLGDFDALRAAGTDMHELAQRGVETFFTQVFEHNFFHADMHPGNIFVDITDPADPSWIAIDCAIMGELTAADRLYLARNLLGFLDQDFDAVARVQIESGWVPAETDPDALAAVIAAAAEPIVSKPLAEIDFGPLLVELFTAAREFDVRVQPQLVLLQKTLLNIEGLGRSLYPELDVWEVAAPYMRRWMSQQFAPEMVAQSLADRAGDIARQLPTLPALLADADYELKRLGHAAREAQTQIADLRTSVRRERRFRWLLLVGLIVLALWA